MYVSMYQIVDATFADATTPSGLSYREAYDMPLDELELHSYLLNSRIERINEAHEKK